MQSKHTLASDGWTLIYRDAKQAAYAHEAIRQGADEDCVGPGEEGWYWYNEGTGQVGDKLNLDAVAAAPKMLRALKAVAVAIGTNESQGGDLGKRINRANPLTVESVGEAIAAAEGRELA